MGAAWYLARADLRRRWKATMVLVLLVGLAGGVVLTTVAGARRSSTAYERFRQETLAGDMDISPSDPDPALFEEVERLPEVEASARTAFPFIRPQGSGLYPYLEFLVMVGHDDKFGDIVDRPRVIEGRVPDPARSDEFVIAEEFAAERSLEVGDRVTFESYAPGQFEDLFGGDQVVEPEGPLVTLTVTGVVGSPDLLGEGLAGFEPRAFLTPAFYREYRDRVGVYEGGLRVRLREGQDEASAFVEAVRQIYRDDPEFEIQLASEFGEKIDDTFGVLVVALVLCAACAGLAAVVAVGQALARHISPAPGDQRILAGLGMSRSWRIAALSASVAPVAVAGALLAVAVAIAASPLMPLGVARRAEPDPGFSVDGAVLGLGFVAVIVVVTTSGLLAAWSASRVAPSAVNGDATGRDRAGPSRLLTLAAGGLPPAATTGVRMALSPGRGRTAVPVRSAMAGVAFGVVGLVASIVFATSLTALVDTPRHYGFPWDAYMPGFGFTRSEADTAALSADPAIRDLSTATYGLTRLGDEDIPVYAFEALKGSVTPTIIEGRAAARADEVVLGSGTLRAERVELGDTIELAGAGEPVRVRIVGRAAFPVLDDRGSVDRGAALTPEGLVRVANPDTFNQDLLVGWAPGVDQASANRRLEERTGAQVLASGLPADVNNLKQVEALPRTLAAFLAVLAAGVLAHTLVTTVRRRRRDLAVLRAFGFVRRQVSATVAWQATTFAVVGLVVGIPLGVVAGRLTWGLVATGIGVVNRPAAPLLLLALIGLAMLLMVNVVAWVPALMAGRVRPAAALRTE